MRTLIKGGTIVTTEQEFVGDILVEGEIIRAMGAHLDEKADRVIAVSYTHLETVIR